VKNKVKNAINLIGKKFGRWTVISRVENKNNKPCWLCRCDCGKEKKVKGIVLKKGESKSCGCLQIRIKNLIGKRFGRWIVVGSSSKRDSCRDAYWLCKCICGKEKEISGRSLKKGNSKGCHSCKQIEEWKNPGYREKHEKMMLQKWQNTEYIEKQIKSREIKPNKLELKFEQFLNNLYPGEWKYVGNFEFWLGGKNPDFMNVNGNKQLIELYGDYWHKGENPQERIDHFKKYGFDTLVIWEKELKDMNKVEEKIIDFSGRNKYAFI
jgi:hypothetical protein